MAIDELAGETSDKANKSVTNMIKANSGTTLDDKSDTTLDDAIEENKPTTVVEDEDDIVFMESMNLAQILEISDEQPQQISPCICKSSGILPPLLNLNLVSSELYPKVKPITLRQYGRKQKKNRSNPNQDQNVSSQNTSDVQSTSSQKSSRDDENLNEGLKSLAEISDSTFSSTSVTKENDSLTPDIVSLKVPTSTSSSMDNEDGTRRRKSEEMQQMDLNQQDTCDTRENEDEQRTNENQKRYEDIQAHLKRMFESHSTESEVRPLSADVKTDNVLVLIGEDGVISIIYKPEKVKLPHIQRFGMNLLNSSSSSEEEKVKENTCNGNKVSIYGKSKEHKSARIQPSQETNKENYMDKIEKPDISKEHIKKLKKPRVKRKNKKYPPLQKVKYKGSMVYKCDKCDFVHPTRISALRRHMLRHQSEDAIEWFYCDLCDYRAKRKGNLKVHLMLHRNPDELVWYKCEMCDKKFKLKTGLKSHEKRHVKREDLEQYMCNICSYKTPFKHTLLRHTLNHEPPDKKTLYKCTSCSYSTYNKYYLRRHRHTHGEPLYKCLLCEYQGKYKVNLESHMKTHFPRDEIIYCDSCDFSTNRKYSLTLHNRRVHKIYTSEADQLLFCFNCSFQTSFKRCLVKHMSIHTSPDSERMLKRIKTEPLTD